MWHLLTHQTSWWTRAPSLHPFKLCDCFFLLSLPALILNAQPESSYVTSYPAPPMLCYFCQFPWIVYLLLAAIFSQGKSSQWCKCIQLLPFVPLQDISGVSECSQSHACLCRGKGATQLLTCHCFAKYLKSCILYFPPQPTFVGFVFPFGGTPTLYPITWGFQFLYVLIDIHLFDNNNSSG